MCWSLCSLARHSIAKGATVQLRKMPRPLCMVSYASICAARRVWFKTDPHHSLRGLFGIDAVGIQRVSHYYLLYVYEKNIHCYINYDIYIIYIYRLSCVFGMDNWQHVRPPDTTVDSARHLLVAWVVNSSVFCSFLWVPSIGLLGVGLAYRISQRKFHHPKPPATADAFPCHQGIRCRQVRQLGQSWRSWWLVTAPEILPFSNQRWQ